MSLFTPSELTALRVMCSIIPTTVALATIGRLYIKTPKRWGYDDLCVSLGMAVMITQQGVLWERSIFESPTLPVFYVVVISSLTQVWLARSSILISVIRIAQTRTSRLVAQCALGLFMLFYVVALAQYVWVCQTHLEYSEGIPYCTFHIAIPIYQLTAAMVADTLLIALPLHTLRLLKGNDSLRLRLQFIFTASIITTCASIVQAILNFRGSGFGVFVAAQMECWISLLVCNLGVLLNALAKRIHPPDTNSSSWRGSTRENIEISLIQFRSIVRDPLPKLETVQRKTQKDGIDIVREHRTYASGKHDSDMLKNHGAL